MGHSVSEQKNYLRGSGDVDMIVLEWCPPLW
jgi:hypothetical protein